MMKAAVLREFGSPLTLEEVEVPVPAADEVLIRVRACGIDGTDLKLLDGFGYEPRLPFIMGHEPAGVVEQVGADVSGFKPGDRVVTYNFYIRGRCPLCRGDREQLCPNMTGVLGVLEKPGGYAEYLKIPARQVLPVPDGIPFADAAVLCDAGITAFHAVDRSRVRLGETVLLFGVGGVGSFVLQFARLAGARVLAVDVTAEKCAHASELGADAVVNGADADVGTAVRELIGGSGVDCVIDVVGRKATIAAGIGSLRSGGRLTLVGYTPESFSVSGKEVAQKELEVIGSRCGRRRDLHGAAALVAAGRTRSIVTDTHPLEQVNEALERLRSGRVMGRCVLTI